MKYNLINNFDIAFQESAQEKCLRSELSSANEQVKALREEVKEEKVACLELMRENIKLKKRLDDWEANQGRVSGTIT